jgi:4-hydroxy-2-oxoheptanedioate aldolase
MRTNTVKAKLRAGETVFGCFVRYPEPALIEMLGYYGWDYLMFDGEHSTITPRDCENLCRAAELRNVSTFVRVTTNQQPVILRFMDTGVQGAMVPMVNSVAEAEAAVRAIKYPPRGARGLAGVRAADYGQIPPFSFPEYVQRANDETMIIAQVETTQAVEALPEIVKLPDIDVIFIGPTDLSTSLGVPGDLKNPQVQAAFDRIIEVVNGSDKALGILVPNAEAALQWVDRGARFVLVVVDALLGPACRGYLKTVREGSKK